jgi:hypothetical protein
MSEGLIFDRNIEPQNKDILFEIIQDGISDLIWNKFFYISESDPVGSAISSGGAYSDSETNDQATLSIKRPSKFRCVFNLLAYNTGGTSYITSNHIRPVNFGYSVGDSDGAWSGFKIDASGLSAVNFNKGEQSEILLETDLATGDDFIVEVQFYPRERTDFYINNVLRASLANNLPSDESLEIYSWQYYEVLSGGSTLDIQRVEFLQEKE